MILERGALLNNRYRIVEILGQGGMGSVYRAVDERLGVEVAVKDNLFTTEEYARQFKREAIILANLRHPNLPRVTDHFVIEGQGQYLVMDYIEGEDLRQRMDRVGMLTDEDAIVIGAAICDALTYLDSRRPSVIHRDIKPGNVKITSQGQIFLVDFGLAKVLEGSQATTTGARAMTPGYSPPEQYGTARTDQRSDIFSLGATLYAALTGAIPEDALARAMEQAELTPIRKRNPKVSRRLASILERSLEIRPDDRYQDAEEFKQALLNCRSNTRRKAGDFIVSPPPDLDDRPMPGNQGLQPPAMAEMMPRSTAMSGMASGSAQASPSAAAGEPAPAFFEGGQMAPRSPSPLPVSTPLEEPEPRRSRPRSRRRKGRSFNGLFIAVIALLFIGGVAAVFSSDPQLPAHALSWLAPVLPGASPPTPSSLPPSLTPTRDATPTSPEAAAVLAATGTATATIEPTVTVTPPPTPTSLPTPLGGGGGQIAFASDSTGVIQVYTINVDGSDLHQITDLPDGACQPDWSPTGERLVFTSPCPSNQETYPGSALFIVNVDGSGLMPLPTVPGGDYDPAWAPDGTRIAFTSLRNNGRPQIYVYHLVDQKVSQLSEKYAWDMQAAWSPDGKRIAFISTRRGTSQIWIMDANGQNQEQFSRSSEMVDSQPAWALDGQAILFTQLVAAGGIPRLIVSPLEDAGEVENRTTSSSLPMREGTYSADGAWIAFEGWPAGSNHDIYVMAINGAAIQQVTNDPRPDFDPDWRPVQ